MQTTYKNKVVSIKHNRVIIVEFDDNNIYLHVTNKNSYMIEVFNNVSARFDLKFTIFCRKGWFCYHEGIVYQFNNVLVLTRKNVL